MPAAGKPPMLPLDLVHDRVGVLLHLTRERTGNVVYVSCHKLSDKLRFVVLYIMIVYSPVNDKLKLVVLAFATTFDGLLNSLFNLCSRIIADQPARFRHVGECLGHVARLRRLSVQVW